MGNFIIKRRSSPGSRRTLSKGYGAQYAKDWSPWKIHKDKKFDNLEEALKEKPSDDIGTQFCIFHGGKRLTTEQCERAEQLIGRGFTFNGKSLVKEGIEDVSLSTLKELSYNVWLVLFRSIIKEIRIIPEQDKLNKGE